MGHYRFGVFHFDAARLELHRQGRLVSLQPQPAQVLATLLARAGELVTRDELRAAVWPGDTFVDFDRGLNFCIAQVRTALGDDAHSPRFVRTLPKRGYEFIYPVTVGEPGGAAPIDEAAPPAQTGPPRPRFARWPAVLVAAVVLAAAVAILHDIGDARTTAPIVAVARFDDETGDPRMSRFADVLADTVVERLTTAGVGAYQVIGNAAVLRRPRNERDLLAIGSSLHAQFVVLGQVQADADRLRVLAHLIRLPDQTHVTVSRTEGPPDAMLSRGDEIARKIADAFNPGLRGVPAKPSSQAPVTR